MANFDAAKAMFSQADTNQDGSIDRTEFNQWASNTSLSSPLSYEGSRSASARPGDAAGKAGLSAYEARVQNFFESPLEKSSSLATSTAATVADLVGSRERLNSATVETRSAQETSEYLARSSNGVYNDPNPEIIRRAAAEGPFTYQQRVFIRFFQPPPVPPPGPLIIKEVRPPQPPPPPPLVVRQRAPPLPTPPPLILRERPPLAPASVASETVIRHLKALPVPPRSVIVERLPPLPPKPRDIIIERWVPYGAQANRRTIVQRAPPAVQYPQPRNIIVVYDAVQTRVVRQFERLGVTQEDPQAYMARYGATLLDPGQLVQQARTAGVIEDISPPAAAFSAQFNSSASFSAGTEGTAASYSLPNAANGQRFSASSGTAFGGLQVVNDFEPAVYNIGGGAANRNANYLSAASVSPNFANDSAFAESAGIGNAGFDVTAASFAAADINRDGRLNRAEFQRFYQGGI